MAIESESVEKESFSLILLTDLVNLALPFLAQHKYILKVFPGNSPGYIGGYQIVTVQGNIIFAGCLFFFEESLDEEAHWVSIIGIEPKIDSLKINADDAIIRAVPSHIKKCWSGESFLPY